MFLGPAFKRAESAESAESASEICARPSCVFYTSSLTPASLPRAVQSCRMGKEP